MQIKYNIYTICERLPHSKNALGTVVIGLYGHSGPTYCHNTISTALHDAVN